MNKPSTFFSRAAHWTALQTGHASTFVVACLVIVVWGTTGPIFHYSDTWQLVINTGTSIVTFLMVFLLQHAQNRDSIAIRLKLDELIGVNREARNTLLRLEGLAEHQLDKVKQAFATIASGGDAALDEVRETLDAAKAGLEDAQQTIDAVRTRATG